jgi:hypothetical protein
VPISIVLISKSNYLVTSSQFHGELICFYGSAGCGVIGVVALRPSQCAAFKRNTPAQSDRNGVKGLGGDHGSANRQVAPEGIESAQIAGVKIHEWTF